MGGKRDSAYYEGRLRRDRPAIWKAYKAGAHKSVREACIAAGFIRPPGRLGVLKREWRRATPAERRQFLEWAKTGSHEAGKKVPTPSPRPIADADGCLSPHVVAFLKTWIGAHRYKAAWIMQDIGLSRSDYTLNQAIFGGTRLREAVIPKLAKWLSSKGYKL
jgi:hypothetical protein